MVRGKIITVEYRQNIYDITLQYYGDDDAVFMLLEDNPELPGLDTVLTAGQKLAIKQSPLNQKVVDYYKQNGIVPVTEVEDSFFEVLLMWGDDEDDVIITELDEDLIAA